MTATDIRRGLRVVQPGEGSPYPKASLFLRGGARLVDLAIAFGLYSITGPAGLVMALLYLLFADGMLHGQSLGKKLWGVKVIYLPNRAPARHRDSVLRNSPLGLAIIFGMMPDVGAKAFVAGVLVVGAIEAWKVYRDPLGIRLGDAWAETQVVDGKVVIGQTVASLPNGVSAPGRVMRAGHAPPGRSGFLALSLQPRKRPCASH